MSPSIENPIESIHNAAGFSRFLTRGLAARSWLQARLEASVCAPLDAEAMRAFLAAAGLNEENLKPVLRHLRAWVISHVLVRDLAGAAPLAEVTGTMTTLAEVATQAALEVLRDALALRYGEPLGPGGWVQEFIVIGMGKLGGGELNVSSDIDLIFVYPEDGETGGATVISNVEFFERLGKQLIKALADITGDGQVFRVDMRLRPNGDSGPLVASLDMLENYFITQGREWERYAWIKARALTGERWPELEAVSRPFIFRKYLDFGAINAMRELHAQIRREVARKDMATNVKLGPGGIREIEFIAQVFQLIRGGRDRGLQIKPTLAVLAALAERGILSGETVAELSTAYDFLRRLEHRLQYLDDAQTHALPGAAEDQARIAASMGFASYGAMLEVLDGHRQRVSRHFGDVFADPAEDGHDLDALWSTAEDQETTAEHLTRLGYTHPADVGRRLSAIRQSARYQQLPGHIRGRFDALVPRLVATACNMSNPDEALSRGLDLLEMVSRRGAYLALLQQYPQALQKVVELLSASSWGAQYLIRHPILMDELLDPRLLFAPPDWTAYRAELAQAVDELEPDMERQMDLMRERHHTQVFRLLNQDLAGALSVETLGDHLSALADTTLDITIPVCWRKIKTRHRDTPLFAVVAYGKLGGKELGYASDLDIVFLFEDEAFEATELYARLGQRINTWLSSQTAAGQLFETDLRLRPNGDSGLLVASLETFRKYQLESAWVWEHQALTRARFAAGHRPLGERFEAIRCEILRQQRNLDTLRQEVLTMRQKMMDAHANKGGEFDLKHDRGGLIDVEFLVQYLVLGYAHAYPTLTGNLGNIALLRIAGELGLADSRLAQLAGDAYRELRHQQHRLRLNNQPSKLPQDLVKDARAAVVEMWNSIFPPR
ncbi:MAG: bifunctional [glutamate--ammonia ligase]-adenylyl-L-tyrosine phosphorylase/[glutamate--ammonia-ligase] adenylyltransferase [Rhodocyclaceae bacterium]|jgi:glutamate-ammonia-ligase adenylyltransferase|nr:bifunctional [glutamate--ammonia ligase]-adenylyl-L-tyrosine phosphorylase/[glutamate--ammonia-ligase] adenylyltransferase [Rhodocyclaceae bacterium]